MQKANIAVLLTDTHLFERGTKKDSILETNYDEVYAAFKKAITLAKENGLEYVIHGGDFFDSRKHQSQKLLELAYSILELFRAENIKLIVVVGNHDKTSYREKFSFLSVFRDHPNLHIVEEGYSMLDDKNKVKFHFLAYFDNDIYLELLDKQLAELHPEYKNVLITHIGIGGVITNSGDKDGNDIKFSHFEDFDKVLIGHYHNYSTYQKDKIVYIGSALQHNFGEDNNKGIVLLNSSLKLQREKTEFKEYRNITLDVTELSQSDIEELVAEKDLEHRKIILTGDSNLIKALDKNKLIEAGIKVEVKSSVIEAQKIEQRIESHSSDSILEEFKAFCLANSYEENEGLSYLKKVL